MRKTKNTIAPVSIWEKYTWLSWVAIMLPLLLIYGQTLSFEFTNWDDDEYVTQNKLIQSLSVDSVKLIFSEFYYLMYIPLTLFTYALEYYWVGENPALFHASNVALHIANTVGVFILIRHFVSDTRISVLAALIFSLHPLRVESVAWISERKDVLFVFFLLIALIQWVHWKKENKYSYYIGSVFFLILSALSKATAVLFVPFIFILDAWFFAKGWKIAVKEKIPFVLLALLTGFVQMKGIQGAVENQSDASGYGLFENFLILTYSFVFYWIKLIVPWGLSAYYPLPDKVQQGLHWGYYLSPVFVVGVLYALWKSWNSQFRWVFFGILWYCAGVFLFLKLRPGGFFIAGDRYTYAASIGISLALAIGIEKLETQLKQKILMFFVGVLGVYTLMSWQQTKIWKDSTALFQSVLKHSPDFYMAYVNLGTAYEQKKNYTEALNAYREAIRLKPAYDQPWYNIGNVMLALDKPQEAIEPFKNAVLVNPQFTKAWNNLGSAWFKMNRFDSAIYCYQNALKLEPGYRSAQSNIGQALLMSGNPLEAYQWMKRAADAEPMDFVLRLQMGEAAEKSGQDSLAKSLYQAVIQNAPQLPEAYLAMAGLYLKSGNVEETLRWCDITLQKFPTYGPAWFNKGVVYYQQGKISEAKALFEESAKLGHPQAIAVLQQGLVK